MNKVIVKFVTDEIPVEWETEPEGNVKAFIEAGYLTFTCVNKKRHFILLDKVEYFNY